jgi:predicted metal-dependent hydrolase
MRRASDAMPRLFSPEELTLRLSPSARLRRLAARPARSATDRERRADEEREAMARLTSWGTTLAERFGLEYKALRPEREGVFGHYGICYDDGEIRIRLRHAKTGRILKESSLVDTLCHELAHLVHMNHGARFRRLYARILEDARALGIYRPGPAEDGRPRQRSLFDLDTCGTGRH